MNETTLHFFSLWNEGRTRFSNQLKHLKAHDLSKKTPNIPNSAGFLIRHIAEVELLFAKNVFGQKDVRVTAKTVIEKQDNGEWTNLPELLEIEQYAVDKLGAAIQNQLETDWQTEITTAEFGTKTKSEALGRIVSHTAYHAGQLAIIIKYGQTKPS